LGGPFVKKGCPVFNIAGNSAMAKQAWYEKKVIDWGSFIQLVYEHSVLTEEMDAAILVYDQIMLHAVRFPFAPKVKARDVVRRLQRLPQLRRTERELWMWADPTFSEQEFLKQERPILIHRLEDGSVGLGEVQLKDDEVVLTVSCAQHADRGRALLSDALMGLVAAPLTEITTRAQRRATEGGDVSSSLSRGPGLVRSRRQR
jgi:hypothetical protein